MMQAEEKIKYGITIQLHDFGQKTFEDYQKTVIRASREAYVQFDEKSGVTASAFVRGETVRAALKYKIISGITLEEINNAKPYVVTWLADEIKAHVVAITTAPSDPN